MSVAFVSYAKTDIGKVRLINEDSYFANPAQGLWIVADGMGGHAAGDYASKLIVDAFADVTLNHLSLSDAVNTLENIIIALNQQLIAYSQAHNLSKVGSTIVLLLLRPYVGVCLWMGDSRLYRLHEHQLTCMTTDHSLIQLLIEQGEISAEEGLAHPARHVITSAIGVADDMHMDMMLFEPHTNDRYLLCSDGFYNMLSVKEMQDMLIKEMSLSTAIEILIHKALIRGATDNITAIGVEFSHRAFHAMVPSFNVALDSYLQEANVTLKNLQQQKYQKVIDAQGYIQHRNDVLDFIDDKYQDVKKQSLRRLRLRAKKTLSIWKKIKKKLKSIR